MKSVVNGETILFAGGHYELNSTTGEVSKYYFAGASRIAVRKYIVPQTTSLTYLVGDHLGSTSLAVDASTGDVIETRYKPWGEVRFTTGNKTLPTRYTFTGQYSYVSDDATDLDNAGFGLMFYNARWYDPAIGRFVSADTIVPGGAQGLDRYAYVNNSPVNYVDPSGHFACEDSFTEEECKEREKESKQNHFGLGISTDPTHPDKLDENLFKDKRAGYLYQLYLKMWGNKSGWWWDVYGAGGFTIWEFMDIFWRWEQSNYPNPRLLAGAMANSAFMYCASAGCDHQSAEGALSFLAYYSQSARMRADAYNRDKSLDLLDLSPPPQNTASMLVVNAIIDRGYGPVGATDPYAVGNLSMAPGILRKMIRLGYVMDFFGPGDIFVILSYCETFMLMAAEAHGAAINSNSYNYYCHGTGKRPY